MKLLMVLRDPVPPTRPDVRVLFDRELRLRGHSTDFVGARRRGQVSESVSGAVWSCPVGSPPTALDIMHVIGHDLATVARRVARYDVLLVRDRPVEAVVLFLIARARRVRTAYWMSFPIPLGDRTAAELHWSRGRWIRAALVWFRGYAGRGIERYLSLPLADHVFVQSSAMRDALRCAGMNGARMTAVPMGVDARAVAGDSPAAAEGEPTVVYLGTLNRARRLDFLLRAFRLVVDALPEARLLLIGGGDDPEDLAYLKAEVSRLAIDRATRFTGPLAQSAAFGEVRRCSIGASPIPPGPLYDVSSPTKAVEYMALGLAVVGNDIPDQRHVIEASGGGLCVPYDERRFADAIIGLLRDRPRREAMARSGRAYVLDHRSYAQLAAAVESALAAVCDEPSARSRQWT